MAQKFKKAKFKNVEFFVAESSLNFGRRNVLHEYPQKDIPFAEDLGRKAREFQIEAYVLGVDAEAQRDKLIAAGESEGPGILVHPYYGERLVVCDLGSIKENCAENRIVRITFNFKEAGKAEIPSISADSAFKVTSAAANLATAAASDFDKVFSVFKQAQFVVNAAADKVRSIASTVKKYAGNAASIYKSAANLAFALQHLNQNVIDFLNSPAKMRAQIEESMRLLSQTFEKINGGSRTAFAAQLAMGSVGADDAIVATKTPSRTKQESNRVAVNNLVKRNALANASTEAVAISFTSAEDAKAVRDSLLDMVDTLSLDANDDVYIALQDLASAIATAIPKSTETLPQILTVATTQQEASLVLAYRIYGTLALEADLVARNSIAHPGFINPSSDIQVLGNG